MKQRIGEEVTEQLEFVPAKLTVIAHVRPKYACNRCDEGVSIASMPQLFLHLGCMSHARRPFEGRSCQCSIL